MNRIFSIIFFKVNLKNNSITSSKALMVFLLRLEYSRAGLSEKPFFVTQLSRSNYFADSEPWIFWFLRGYHPHQTPQMKKWLFFPTIVFGSHVEITICLLNTCSAFPKKPDFILLVRQPSVQDFLLGQGDCKKNEKNDQSGVHEQKAETSSNWRNRSKRKKRRGIE